MSFRLKLKKFRAVRYYNKLLLTSAVCRNFRGIMTIWSLFGQTLYSDGSKAVFVLIWEVSIDRLQTEQIVSQRLSTQVKGEIIEGGRT